MSGFISSPPPTLAGFQSFVTDIMQIPSSALTITSPTVSLAFEVASAIVNPAINQVSPLIYTLCVYNLAASNLVNFAIDQEGQDYFSSLRKQFGVLDLIIGEVQSASDQGTSSSLLVPDFVKKMSLSDMQLAKDPWGRQYLIYAQKYGPGIWGLT